MLRIVSAAAALALAVSFFAPTNGFATEYDIKASLSGGSTSNLFNDSTSRDDTFSAVSLEVKFIPAGFASANLLGDYIHYGDYFRLSNLRYGGGLTVIPMSDSSRLSLLLEGNILKREYHGNDSDSTSINPNEITGNEYDAALSARYDLTPTFRLRTGISFTESEYDVEGVLDRMTVGVTIGGNASFWNNLSLDCEGGYQRGKFQHIDPFVHLFGLLLPRRAILPGQQYSILLEDNLNSVYVSPRLATNIGKKTGVSLTYSYRRFLDFDDDAIIYGYSTGYLSPWLGSFAGNAAVLRLKTFLVPRLITTLSVGFWERDHLRTVEQELRPDRFGRIVPDINLLYAQNRTDWRRRIDLRLQWPLSFSGGAVLEPSLELDFTDNNSSVQVYDCTNFSLSVGVVARL